MTYSESKAYQSGRLASLESHNPYDWRTMRAEHDAWLFGRALARCGTRCLVNIFDQEESPHARSQ